MGLQSLINSAVTTAFNATGDLTTSGTLKKKASASDYDPTTMQANNSFTDLTITKLIITQLSSVDLKEEGILPTDRKVLINGVDLAGYVVTKEDKLVVDGCTCTIEKILTPPKNLLCKLIVRGYQ